MCLAAVFLLSLSSLAFEILLARNFAITQWNHLSFMVISIALFGFAFSGTALFILDRKKKDWLQKPPLTKTVSIIIALYSLSTLLSFILLSHLPLDYFRLPYEFIQALYLLAAYLLLSLPFFFAGFVISLCYAYLPEKTAAIYFMSMAGSAVGALIPLFLLPFIGDTGPVVLVAVVPATLLFFNTKDRNTENHRYPVAVRYRFTSMHLLGLIVMIVAALLASPAGETMIDIKPSPYKSLSQNLKFPKTRIVETKTSLRGRIDRIESAYIRFAPGLSLKFGGTLPVQKVLFRDADTPFVLYDLPENNQAPFAKYTLSFSGYLLCPDPQKVLLIQNGGGIGIPTALSSRAKKITVVEQHPVIAGVIREHYALPVITANARSYMARFKHKFDIIHIESWGTSIPGTNALDQEYLFTREAFQQYYRHLSDKGVLIISRKLLLPPCDSIRLWATAYESLNQLGFTNPEKHLVLLRNWDTFTLLVSPGSFARTDILRRFTEKLNFDPVYHRNVSAQAVNRFNVFQMPYHYMQIKRLATAYLAGRESDYFSEYLLDVAPQSDRRPFPNRFLKWNRLVQLYKTTGSRMYTLLMSGEIMVATVLVEALGVSILLLLLPLLFTVAGKKTFLRFSQSAYFLAVGLGFMFVEMYYIKSFILVFGNPIISLTVILCGILVFSGIGGILSRQFDQPGLKRMLIVISFVLALTFIFFDRLVNALLSLPIGIQYLSALLMILPSGMLMGIPFPAGLRCFLERPDQRAYAWAVNGCASVVTSILSAQIALSIGIPSIVICAAVCYFLAFICTAAS